MLGDDNLAVEAVTVADLSLDILSVLDQLDDKEFEEEWGLSEKTRESSEDENDKTTKDTKNPINSDNESTLNKASANEDEDEKQKTIAAHTSIQSQELKLDEANVHELVDNLELETGECNEPNNPAPVNGQPVCIFWREGKKKKTDSGEGKITISALTVVHLQKVLKKKKIFFNSNVASLAKDLHERKTQDKEELQRYSQKIEALRQSFSKRKGGSEHEPVATPNAPQGEQPHTLMTAPSNSQSPRKDTTAQIQEMQLNVLQLPQLHGFLEKKSGTNKLSMLSFYSIFLCCIIFQKKENS
ncbi:hypothetical protein RFI_12413 [Reticulomyxa filosa]|uniref:Uncharacterized protein n=1 Tax=Reticulomyxa filosa TaxID=46433 RepID=X6NFS1_RETFI|nr:hypothetical protein RFI_12413 [Reticulomyxa filosa]|eukprot:ETO24743.1 hypothetical protein RFI_12413 [Reticulomyxa filosa]